MIDSPEKSSLFVAYIMSHEVSEGSVVGPGKCLNCIGYPEKNRIPRKVTQGAEELIRYTDKEIMRAEK